MGKLLLDNGTFNEPMNFPASVISTLGFLVVVML